ncbi:tetratricopeptide repeat protein [Leptolyngbya cf. ectocarpi LEGE 11479]|uniref:Tetratricopeptide repeat protein n=1 Tax=Leptolyngbya cf. ectocarpi LEGE 11479 TaxID=1828722 RepID=A0A928X122_LEPEC|nr:tetratricopeptide repeat protein [Leptolyngbya ectocarpi]MBE9066982.1 tetratricopeptide repeat protein [Leptolyngbya cf. ectocarpi LEGE 11479]
MTLSIPLSSRRHLILTCGLVLGLSLIEPILNPPAANACFFWQSCAQRRGRASNTQAGGVRTGRIRGGNDAAIPYVISPRNSWMRQPGPDVPYAIRWNPVEGADSYTVRLWQWTYEQDQPSFALWESTEETNEIPFPNLVLEPGRYYSIEVVTDSGVSSNLDEGFYQSGFQILFEEDYEVLALKLAEVTPAGSEDISLSVPANTVPSIPTDATPAASTSINLTTETEDTVLAKAGVYFLEEMYADALAILYPLTANPASSDWVYTALGDTYSQMGLNQLAIETYGQALSLATSNNNVLSEAIARVNLADVYAILGQFEDALDQLTLARLAYDQLQEDVEVARLDRRIQLLSRLVSEQSKTTRRTVQGG